MLATTDLTTEVSLKQILETPGDFSGWLYLPPMPWTLDTAGTFLADAQHAEDDVSTSIAQQPDWSVTLNSATIEDVVINAHDQVDEPSVAQLLDAFVFCVENDAFILF
ncbi:hypothetical protein LGN21_25445 [Burkholderia cepacia]|uniref:DUF7716 domain-containing protein n=1 Tax=Burkholderia cepacia TaxID=292 RepID=UPI001CF2F5FF|nr:hypothetical protein [Burkholderia cepacia]MCA8282937.1 hypothetical protein [Burkholderia cepacia]